MRITDWAGRDISVPMDGVAFDKRVQDAANKKGLPVYGYRYDTGKETVEIFFNLGYVGADGYRTLEKVSLYIGDIITGEPRVVSPGLKALVI